MKHAFQLLLAGLVVTSAAAQVSAELITFVFDAEVTQVRDNNDFLGDAVSVGDTFSGLYTFESATPDGNPGDMDRGEYDNAVTTIVGLLEDIPFASTTPGRIVVVNQDAQAASPRDFYFVYGDVVISGRAFEFNLQLGYTTHAIFDNDALPRQVPPLEPVSFAEVQILSEQDFGLGVVGAIRDFRLIPEPGTLGLVLMGATLLLRRPIRTRRRTKAPPGCGAWLFLPLGALLAFPAAWAHAQTEICGCTDLVLIVDISGSMQTPFATIKSRLADTAELGRESAGNDLRLGLISFTSARIFVNAVLSSDVDGVLDDLALLDIVQIGSGAPEPSDEALREMLSESICTNQDYVWVIGDFNVPFRSECIKHAVLVTDDLPSGCDFEYDIPEDRDSALARANEGAEAGVMISAVYVTHGSAAATVRSVMENYANRTRGVYVETVDGTDIADGLATVIGECPDCNENEKNDLCDIDCQAADCTFPCGNHDDCNNNAVPDVCEFGDCNDNLVLDLCEIASGQSPDCNGNKIPDSCDITEYDCCTVHGWPGCSDPDIQACVCTEDAFCCDTEWDQFCVAKVGTYGCAGCSWLDCNRNGVPDDCDIAEGPSSDANADGVPDECGVLPAPYPHDFPKNRYISFSPDKAALGDRQVSFKIELKSIAQGSCSGDDSPACRYAQGTGQNEPGDNDCRRCSGDDEPCISAAVDCTPNTQTCGLSAETCSNDDPTAASGTNVGLTRWVGPESDGRFLAVTEASRELRFTSDWPDVIHVGDCEIVPQAVYGIRAVDEATGMQSDELLVSTTERPANGVYAWWADLVGSPTQFCNGDYRQSECTSPGDCGGDPCRLAWSPPNGFVNIDDISAVLQVFAEFGTSQVTPIPPGPMARPSFPDITWVDLNGDGGSTGPPQGRAVMTDVAVALAAFSGRPYPYSDPADCPDVGDWLGAGAGFAPEGAMGGGGMDNPLMGGVYSLVASADQIGPGQTVTVEVFLDTVENLGTYQVSLEVVGGTAGSLNLEGVSINTSRQDYVFTGASAMTGASLNGGSLGAALTNPGGWTFEAPAYVGTFTYRASQDAQGVFNVNVVAFPGSFVNRANGSRIDVSTEATTAVGCDVECMADEECADANACTVDTCVLGVCTFTPVSAGTTCDDGLFCTVGEQCDGSGHCAGGTSPCTKHQICCEFWDECRTGSCFEQEE